MNVKTILFAILLSLVLWVSIFGIVSFVTSYYHAFSSIPSNPSSITYLEVSYVL